jgi:hypothetical protein
MKDTLSDNVIKNITLIQVAADRIVFDTMDDYIPPEVGRAFRININRRGTLIFIPDEEK